METNHLKINNNRSMSINSQIEYNKNVLNIILQNKKSFEALKKELLILKDKKQNIKSLGELSKELYLTSIPVLLLFTAFIEQIATGRFDPLEYLVLNSIATPVSILLNSFICGTSLSRKKELENISTQIKTKEEELSLLCHHIRERSNNIQLEIRDSAQKCIIKPIDYSLDNNNIKSLTKKMPR